MDFKTVKPEELCDPTLIGYITKLLKSEAEFPEIFAAAYENRNANNLVFSIPSELSITGRQIDVIADRAHLLKEPQYRPHEWNAWPDVIPPRLDTEPAINGETRECDYWLVKLKNGSYRTGKITKDKYWVRFENKLQHTESFHRARRKRFWRIKPSSIPAAGMHTRNLNPTRKRFTKSC